MRILGRIDVYEVPEVAELLKLRAVTVRRYIRKGRLAARKCGNSYLVTERALTAFLEGSVMKPDPEADRAIY